MHKYIVFVLLGAMSLALAPTGAFAASTNTDMTVAGWIPYWQDTLGIKSAKKNINTLDIAFPFAFTVKQNGTLHDNADLDESKWKKFFRDAEKKDVAIIPTVMTADGALVHTLLSDPAKRAAHINALVEMVEDGDFDGVDIDYESKKSETKDYFSLFLKELNAALGDKMLTCTVEARTPPASLYKNPPAVIDYANDYTEIAKHCDYVEIMAYDQQRADIKLNEERSGKPYFPVADAAWVEKVVALAVQDIPKEKILLGVSTYGYHYQVTVSPNWFQSYQRIGALNMPDLEKLAKKNKVKIGRMEGGEAAFTYLSKKDKNYSKIKKMDVPKDTPKGMEAAAQALAYANKTGETVTVNLGWYGDATAAKDKIALIEKYGLAGISLFKIDGEEDKGIWSALK